MALYDTFLDHITVAAISTVAFILLIIVYNKQRYRNLPPGPWGPPLFGYWLFFKSDTFHLQMQELRNKYGEVFYASIAGRNHIFLSSMKMLKEVSIKKADYFERYTGFSLLTYTFDGGITLSNGESWKTQRKFFHQAFKEYGMLFFKGTFSNSISDYLSETVQEMRALEGQPLRLGDLLTSKCCCIIRRILFNDQGITEEELKQLNVEYEAVVAPITPKTVILFGNIARYLIFSFMPSYWAMVRSHDRIVSIVKGVIKRHKSTFDKTQVMDIIDSFYKEKHDREIKGDTSAVYFTDEALLYSLYQFLADGVLSVAFLIIFFLQSIINYPEEQEKIYEELIEVLGSERQPTIDDKNNLPYTNAFINETIRFANFFPIYPSLECTKETTLNGYRIPKGTMVNVNVYSIHNDPSIYKDPFQFNPSRYLSAPGKHKPDLPIMFGLGKRACLGEPFVMNQVFLFLATLVKNFRFSGETGGRLSILGGTNTPIYAHSRN